MSEKYTCNNYRSRSKGTVQYYEILDSERSEECIGITMMFIFFFYPINRFSTRKSAPISTNDSFSFSKFHREGTLERYF
jgi:hypothetical protein